MNRSSFALVAALAIAASFAACRSHASSRVEALYRELREERVGGAGYDPDERASEARQAERRHEVHRLLDARRIKTASDYWMAAVILVESDSIEDLALADTLARTAARLGEPIGMRVAAEAVDKQLVKGGMHQRYGTQFYYDEQARAWRLYPVDPRTSDEERRAMGVEPLEELRRDEARMNGG